MVVLAPEWKAGNSRDAPASPGSAQNGAAGLPESRARDGARGRGAGDRRGGAATEKLGGEGRGRMARRRSPSW